MAERRTREQVNQDIMNKQSDRVRDLAQQQIGKLQMEVNHWRAKAEHNLETAGQLENGVNHWKELHDEYKHAHDKLLQQMNVIEQAVGAEKMDEILGVQNPEGTSGRGTIEAEYSEVKEDTAPNVRNIHSKPKSKGE